MIPQLISLKIARNTGAAFSLFSDATNILTILSLIVSLILIYIIWFKTPAISIKSIGLAFLLGGTLGNGIDRLFKGYVLDFLELVPIDFPIFNPLA